MNWTQDTIDTMLKLHSENYSGSQIAKELGNGLTRNAVIGKLHRLGIRSKPAMPVIRQVKSVRGLTHRNIVNRLTREPPPPMVPEPEPVATMIKLQDLTTTSCRWPFGDPASPDFCFCGKTAERQPYCLDHQRVAYTCR